MGKLPKTANQLLDEKRMIEDIRRLEEENRGFRDSYNKLQSLYEQATTDIIGLNRALDKIAVELEKKSTSLETAWRDVRILKSQMYDLLMGTTRVNLEIIDAKTGQVVVKTKWIPEPLNK
jgi:hypothetical protein